MITEATAQVLNMKEEEVAGQLVVRLMQMIAQLGWTPELKNDIVRVDAPPWSPRYTGSDYAEYAPTGRIEVSAFVPINPTIRTPVILASAASPMSVVRAAFHTLLLVEAMASER